MAATKLVREKLAPPLPVLMKLANGKLSVVAKNFEERYMGDALRLFQRAADAGVGFHRHEVEDDVLRKKFLSSNTLVFEDEKNQELASILCMPDSPVCRSTRGMTHTMFIAVGERYSGAGLARKAYELGYKLSIDKGYLGAFGRISLNTRNIIPTIASGGHLTGSIPLSTFSEKVGYVDDLLAFLSYRLHELMPEFYAELCKERNDSLPALNEDHDTLQSLCTWNDLPATVISSPIGKIRIRSVKSTNEVLETEKMLRELAEKGIGVGLDEFDSNGHFNRKFLRSTDLIIAEGPSGEVTGAAWFGPSDTSRIEKPVTAHQYLTVKEEFRHNGVASGLMKYCTKTAKQQGYKLIINDTYLTSLKMIDLYRNHKWVFIGSMPYCGYIKGYGPTDSFIIFLPL